MAVALPWHLKMAAKIVLSRLPVGYGLWRRLSLFKHGAMERPEYAYKVFAKYYGKYRSLHPAPRSCVLLELGPGDSLFSAINAHCHGVRRTYLVDSGAFAVRGLEPYRAMIRHLMAREIDAAPLLACGSVESLLEACHAEYRTQGLASIRTIPDHSVDLIYSHTVLQHIRRGEFADYMAELRRIVAPDGLCTHKVDLEDMLAKSLNHLRFSDACWESGFLSRAGFYTNRFRCSEMMAIFQRSGFEVSEVVPSRWDRLPVPRRRMQARFREFSEEELCIRAFDVDLRPARTCGSPSLSS